MKHLVFGLFLFAFLQAEPASASSLQAGDAARLGFDPAGLSALDARLQAEIDRGGFPGAVLLIAREGRIAHLSTLGRRTPDGAPMGADSLFRIYSMTKPIVSVAALALVEQGKLDLDQPLGDLIPAYATTRVATGALDANGAPETVAADRPITIRDLMRHTSGLTYGFFGQGVVREAYRKAAADSAGLSNVAAASHLASLPLEHQPGTTWEYSRATDVLGAVIEIAAGAPLADVLDALVFTPLGMDDTVFTVSDPAEHPRIAEPYPDDRIGRHPLFDPREERAQKSGGGGLMSTVHDYARFTQMLLNGGELDGVRVLQADTDATMTRHHTPPDRLKHVQLYVPALG